MPPSNLYDMLELMSTGLLPAVFGIPLSHLCIVSADFYGQPAHFLIVHRLQMLTVISLLSRVA